MAIGNPAYDSTGDSANNVSSGSGGSGDASVTKRNTTGGNAPEQNDDQQRQQQPRSSAVADEGTLLAEYQSTYFSDEKVIIPEVDKVSQSERENERERELKKGRRATETVRRKSAVFCVYAVWFQLFGFSCLVFYDHWRNFVRTVRSAIRCACRPIQRFALSQPADAPFGRARR